MPLSSQESLHEYPTAEADRGRHPGFPSFSVLEGGPGSLAERSMARVTNARGKGKTNETLVLHAVFGLRKLFFE
jgi:hypothetical protein